MTLTIFLETLRTNPKAIKFEDTMAIIESLYEFEETQFTNGSVENKAGENSGSCKVFSFAQLQNLSQEETLNCFGQYYNDVLQTPNEQSHQNIRQFIINGWDGIKYEKIPLKHK